MGVPTKLPHIDVVYSGGVWANITLTQDDVDRYLKSCLHDSCEYIRDKARSNHDFTSRTGNLERAIRYMVLPRVREGRIGRVYIDTKLAPHGKWVLEGTGLYGIKHSRIFPRRAKALHWFSKKGVINPWSNRKRFKPPLQPTEWVLRSIRGMRGEDFLGDAYRQSTDKVNDIFEDGVRRLLDGKL